MSDLKPEDLKKVKQLRDEAKFEEALELIRNLEDSGVLSPENNLDSQILKGEIYYWMGRYSEAIEICEEAYQESQRIGTDNQSFDALIFKLLALGDADKIREGKIIVDRIFESISEEPSSEFDRRKVLFNILKCKEHFLKGELEQDLKLCKEIIEFYKESGDIFLISRIFIDIGFIFFLMGDLSASLEWYEKGLALREQLGNQILISKSLFWITNVLSLLGDLDRVLEYGKRCLELKQISDSTKIGILENIGASYKNKGESELALEYSKRGLALAEKKNLKVEMARGLFQIGEIYYMQGKFDLALKTLKRSLALSEEIGSNFYSVYSLVLLIITTVEMGFLEEARLYLKRLEQISDQYKLKTYSQFYRFGKAYILKTSTRTQDLGEATRLLKEIIEEKITDFVLTYSSLVLLCDILLIELRVTNNPEVLDEINPIISRLVKISEDHHSYRWLTAVNILQAKLALIQMDVDQARKYYTQAQRIASWHNLQGLARMASDEHDKLLEQQDKWENLDKTKAPISERIELASLDGVMDRLKERSVIEPPKLETEQSVAVVVFSQTGYMAFYNRFTADSTFDEKIVGNFITMSGQMGSQSLDRLRFGDFTVLLNIVESFSICYVFKGQSYSAGQKLNNFTEAVKENKTIIELLNAAIRTGQQVRLSDNPDLEELITISFMADLSKFQLPFKAYKGDEPFIFVSYAHSDKLQVYPIMDYLNKSGFNVWYDEGISVSEDWKESIVTNIEKCSAFLVFITPHIIDSKYVRKEISFALDIDKSFYAVYLKDTTLPSSLKFEISGIQSMKKYIMPDIEFYDKIKEVISPVLSGKK